MSDRPALRTLLRAAVTVGLLAVLVAIVGPASILAGLARIDAGAFAAACAFFFVAQWFHAWRWRRLLEVHLPDPPTTLYLYGLALVGMFANFFLPSAVGGDLVRGEVLRARIGRRREAWLSVAADRAFGLLSTLFVGAVASAVAWRRFGWVDRELAVAAALFALPFAGAALALVGSWPERLAGLAAGSVLERPAGAALRLLASARAYRDHPGALTAVFAASLVVQVVGNVLTVWVLARGMGLEVPVAAHFVVVPVMLLVTLLPISINGVGVRDGVFALLYGRLGVAPEDAIALSVAWTLMLAAVGACGALLLLDPERYRWRRRA